MNRRLDAGYSRLTRDFPELLDRLKRGSYPQGFPRGRIPKQGVYAFREGAVTWYVGRTDTMARRWAEHTGAGSDENKASFAFLLAKKKANAAGIRARSRKALAGKEEFKPYFDRAKERIRRMSRFAVVVVHPTKQALFEIYAAVVLRAKHSDFGNH